MLRCYKGSAKCSLIFQAALHSIPTKKIIFIYHPADMLRLSKLSREYSILVAPKLLKLKVIKAQ